MFTKNTDNDYKPLHPDMLVYEEDEQGNPHYSFVYIDYECIKSPPTDFEICRRASLNRLLC